MQDLSGKGSARCSSFWRQGSCVYVCVSLATLSISDNEKSFFYIEFFLKMSSGRTDEWTMEAWTDRPTIRPMNGRSDHHTVGTRTTKLTRQVLGHSLIHSLIRSSTHSFARTAHSLAPALMGKRFKSLKWMRLIHLVSAHCAADQQILL